MPCSSGRRRADRPVRLGPGSVQHLTRTGCGAPTSPGLRHGQAQVRLLSPRSKARRPCSPAAFRQPRGGRCARPGPACDSAPRAGIDAQRRARSGPHAETLHGGSWLYQLAPYRSLFPRSFLASATPADPRDHLNSLSLWGQFLRGDGRLYKPRAEAFIRAFERATSVDALLAAFPLPRLNLVASIQDVQVWLRTGPATDRHPELPGGPR